jgi:antitoxin VapB
MAETAKLLNTVGSQVTQLPEAFRFESPEGFIGRVARTQNVILPMRPPDWSGLFELEATTEVPADFLSKTERGSGLSPMDPFDPIARGVEAEGA